MSKKSFLSVLLILMLAMSLAACQKPEAPAAEQPAVTVPAEALVTTYPLTITDGEGKTVTLESEPMKIVSLSPNATETIFALGAGDKLVGRTDFCNYPAETTSIPSVGAITEPNIETIASMDPDLIVISNMFTPELRDKLEALGYKVLDLSSHDTFEGVYTSISNTGLILNKQGASAKLIDEMKTTIAEIEEKVKGVEPKTVYYVVGFGEYGDYTAGANTFIDQMITMAGGINVAQDTEGWKYSVEKLVENDPEIVICSKYYDSQVGIEMTNGYKELTAVKEGRLIEIDNDLLDRQGPRTAEGLLELVKIIHPELF
ncbi:MAG: ABC transporter substrate-binding protein [Erysipelotrichaceae bacterium]|nr:ABC transporter substrate-binding protein [Erysipelotrichaceae bacterium]